MLCSSAHFNPPPRFAVAIGRLDRPRPTQRDTSLTFQSITSAKGFACLCNCDEEHSGCIHVMQSYQFPVLARPVVSLETPCIPKTRRLHGGHESLNVFVAGQSAKRDQEVEDA